MIKVGNCPIDIKLYYRASAFLDFTPALYQSLWNPAPRSLARSAHILLGMKDGAAKDAHTWPNRAQPAGRVFLYYGSCAPGWQFSFVSIGSVSRPSGAADCGSSQRTHRWPTPTP